MTTTMNYISNYQVHEQRYKSFGLFFMSVVGLILVFLTNSHSIPKPMVFALSPLINHRHDILHALHSHTSILHKVTNVVGCGMLLGSNYLSRRIFGCSTSHGGSVSSCGTCSSHDLSHSHDHAH